jgi:hypothetical protein
MRRSILTWLAALAVLAVPAVSPAAGGDLQRHSAQAQSQDQRAQANPNFRVIGDARARVRRERPEGGRPLRGRRRQQPLGHRGCTSLRQLKKPTVILASDRDSGLWIVQYRRD